MKKIKVFWRLNLIVKIESEFSPIYEIVNSLFVFSVKNNFHDFGKSWVKEIQSDIDNPEFLSKLQENDPFPFLEYLFVLIWKTPEKQDITKFLFWLENLTPGEIYEILSPYSDESLPGNLGEIRDHYVFLLRIWSKEYRIENHVIEKLEEKSLLVESSKDLYEPATLVEELTNGIYIIPTEQTKMVVLIPSYYLKPMNFFVCLNNIVIIIYSIDFSNESSMLPPLALSRMTRALGDEKRLQILKILAEKPYKLTDLAKEMKLSKSNLHYHLTLLRIAGLVRDVKDLSTKYDKYEIRPNVFTQLLNLLEEYVLQKK